MDMPSRFQAGDIEEKWYQRWLDSGVFHVKAEDARHTFTIMIPPPNVTGALHMGHALNNTLQDIVARYQRLRGRQVLWLPGTDHAGIATQAVVEKKLYSEKKVKRQDIGREAFVAEIWKWKEEYGHRILQQLRKLGYSCDWERTRFTLDEGLSEAVRESFVRLWEKGWIYRGERLINWDCRLQTAVSDDEIEQSELRGKLYYLRYPVEDQPGRFLVVATTRPETMFGDTGVAVHPEDSRYADLVGKRVVLPIVERPITIVADTTVDPAFGTGAVKVTPGHDPNDYERGQRHQLPIINVLHKDGTLNAEAGPFAGIERLEARPQLVARLDELGLLEKVEDHIHNVPHSDRSKTPIEPLISEQWFVAMREMAQPAIAAVQPNSEGKRVIQFVPARWEAVYLSWLENVRDWCISRQLWWGHRIPVWYDEDGNSVALRDDPAPGAMHPTSGKPLVRQDEDVLDTWASSWLWPFSTLGWPQQDAPDLKAFYPTQFLSTDRGILYLWVARMVMASYEFLGTPPFDTVYIHATVLDGQGRRMSKSLGNGIDPLEMVESWGVDAVRLTLPLLTSEGQDIKLSPTKFEMGRNFCNKLWNACRFALTNLTDLPQTTANLSPETLAAYRNGHAASLEDAFVLTKLHQAVANVTDALDKYRFNEAAQTLYRFTWDELCDWYLEVVKPRLYDDKGGPESKLAAQMVLVRCIDAVLRLLHPFTPFITEEIYHSLKPSLQAIGLPVASLICEAKWPQAQEYPIQEAAADQFDFLREVTRAIRTVRATHNLDRKVRLHATVRTASASQRDLLGTNERQTISHLSGLESLEVSEDATKPRGAAAIVLGGGTEVYVHLEGLVDFSSELNRALQQIAKVEIQRSKVAVKLDNASYVERAPEEVVQKDRDRLQELDAELATLRAHIEELHPLVHG